MSLAQEKKVSPGCGIRSWGTGRVNHRLYPSRHGQLFLHYAFRGTLSERVILYFIGYDLTLLYLLDGKYNCNNSHSRDFNSLDRITSF